MDSRSREIWINDDLDLQNASAVKQLQLLAVDGNTASLLVSSIAEIINI